LMLSGIAGFAMPKQVASALDIPPGGLRGIAEARVGLGGTYAALGAWALVSRAPAAQTAVGVTWLGAAAARVAAYKLDRPRTDWTFWAYLAGEFALGATALGTRASRSTAA